MNNSNTFVQYRSMTEEGQKGFHLRWNILISNRLLYSIFFCFACSALKLEVKEEVIIPLNWAISHNYFLECNVFYWATKNIETCHFICRLCRIMGFPISSRLRWLIWEEVLFPLRAQFNEGYHPTERSYIYLYILYLLMFLSFKICHCIHLIQMKNEWWP